MAFTIRNIGNDGKPLWFHHHGDGRLLGWSRIVTNAPNGATYEHYIPVGRTTGISESLNGWVQFIDLLGDVAPREQSPILPFIESRVIPNRGTLSWALPDLTTRIPLWSLGAIFSSLVVTLVIIVFYQNIGTAVADGSDKPVAGESGRSSNQPGSSLPTTTGQQDITPEQAVTPSTHPGYRDFISPDGHYSVGTATSAEGRPVLLVKEYGKVMLKESITGYELSVLWSPGGNFVAINERRIGDSLWIMNLRKSTVLKAPDDNLWFMMASKGRGLLTQAKSKWGENVKYNNSRGLAATWETDEILVAKVVSFFSGSLVVSGDCSLEARVRLKVTNESAGLEPEKPQGRNEVSSVVETISRGDRRVDVSSPVPGERAAIVHDASMPGERFPQTRMRLLSLADLTALSLGDARYAINEMFARHGAWFERDQVRADFSTFSWYKPQKDVPYDEIEKSFNEVEKANLLALAAYRDRISGRDKPALTKPNTEQPRKIEWSPPQTDLPKPRRDTDFDNLDRY